MYWKYNSQNDTAYSLYKQRLQWEDCFHDNHEAKMGKSGDMIFWDQDLVHLDEKKINAYKNILWWKILFHT